MITKKIYLYFPKSETEKPIVYQLVKEFDLIVNIFRAKVTPRGGGLPQPGGDRPAGEHRAGLCLPRHL